MYQLIKRFRVSLFLLLPLVVGCSQSFDGLENGFLNNTSDTPLYVSDSLDVDSTEALYALGQQQYKTHCASCHGSKGAGSPGSSILSSIRAGSAINHTAASMPLSNPALCGSDCSTAVIAWVANQNNIELNIQIGSTAGNSDEPNTASKTFEPRLQTYQRATTLFSRTLPTVEELNSLANLDEESLRNEIRKNMSGEGFRAFIKDGANDRLLFRGIKQNSFRVIHRGLEGEYPRYTEGSNANDFHYKHDLAPEFAESPLELIYHVVSNDRPYSEVLTADYVMVSKYMADIYETGLAPNEGEWMMSDDYAQRVSGTRFSASSDWDESRKIDRPNAGILTSWAYLSRYPTTATNRNRARAKQTMLHFLGYDIEASAPRLELDDSVNSDNPTLDNPACTACHTVMDPIAGAFQNFGDKGIFNESRYGLDSLDNGYKSTDSYTQNDTWYRDMLAPGFYGKDAPAGSNQQGQSNSIVWIAKQIVNDPRFATGTVKFWWSSVYGRDHTSNDFETIEEFAANFSVSLNLKDLLVDMVMHKTYRLGAMNTSDQPQIVSPELMSEKFSQISTVESSFASDHIIFFGGHDSWTSTKRERDINAVMLNVLKNNAYKNSCRMTFEDFALPTAARKLFSQVELETVAGSLKRLNTSPNKTNTDTTNTTKLDVTGQQTISLAIRGGNDVDAYLTHVKVTDQLGRTIFDGQPTGTPINGSDFFSNTTLTSANWFGARDASNNMLLTLPTLNPGTTELTLVFDSRARYNGSEDSFMIIDIIGSNHNQSLNSDRIKYQLVDLAQLLWAEQYSVEDAELLALFDLYLALQRNAQKAGQTDTEFGNVACNGTGRQRYYDLDYTFSAWKGVLATMLSDVSFLLN